MGIPAGSGSSVTVRVSVDPKSLVTVGVSLDSESLFSVGFPMNWVSPVTVGVSVDAESWVTVGISVDAGASATVGRLVGFNLLNKLRILADLEFPATVKPSVDFLAIFTCDRNARQTVKYSKCFQKWSIAERKV